MNTATARAKSDTVSDDASDTAQPAAPVTKRLSPEELRKTLIVRLALDECSAKVRTGGPLDDEEDMDLGHWAGVLPLSIVPGTPDPDVELPVPDYISRWTRAR